MVQIILESSLLEDKYKYLKKTPNHLGFCFFRILDLRFIYPVLQIYLLQSY